MKELEWRDVDLAGRVVRLRREVSKNKDGLVLPLSADLLEIIEREKTQRRLECPYVFHLDGEQVGDFKRSVGDRLQEGGHRQSVGSPSAPDRRPQHVESRNPGSSCDGAIGAQDTKRLRSV
jgi:integrase